MAFSVKNDGIYWGSIKSVNFLVANLFCEKIIIKLYACSYNVYKSNQLSVMALYFIIYENILFLRGTSFYAHAYKNT